MDDSEEVHFIQKYPKWDWHIARASYDWQSNCQHPCPSFWAYGDQWWRKTVFFWNQLQWRIHPEAQTSVAELAFLFWIKTRTMPPDTETRETASFSTIMRWVRYWVRINMSPQRIIPAEVVFYPRKCLRLNQPFAWGLFQGGRPFLERHEMILLSRFVFGLPNHGSNAVDWDCGVSCLP